MAMQKLQRTQQPAAKASTPAKQKSFGSTGGEYRGTGNTATQSRSSGENEFANALATVTSSNAATEGPASIRTPELDSAVGNTNATGPISEYANPDNWTGDAGLYLQMGGDVDMATVRGLDNIGRRYLGDMAGGIRNTINEAGYLAQGSMGGMQNDPTLSGDALLYMQTFGDEIPKVEELKRTTNFGQNFQNETQQLYGDMTGGWKTAGDLAGTIGQQTPAMALNLVPGAGQALSSAYLFGSAAGAATEEAATNGADPYKAMQYGVASGAVEAATEKIFDGMAGLLGRGAADDVVEKVIGKMTERSGSNALRNALRLGFGALGEGAEEGISALADPILRSIYNNQTVRENYRDIDWGDVLYQIELGALSGGVLGSLGMANGQFRGKNAALNQRVVTEVVNDVLTNSPEGQATAQRAQEAVSAENPLTQTILANEQGQQEQGSEFNAPQAAQTNEPALRQAGTQTAPTSAQSDAIEARAREIWNAPYEDEVYGTVQRSTPFETASNSEKYNAYIDALGVDIETVIDSDSRAASLYSFLNDLVGHGGDLDPRAAAQTFAEFLNKRGSVQDVINRAYGISGQAIPAGIAAQYNVTQQNPTPATPVTPIAETVLNNEQHTPPTEQQPGQVRSQSEANTIQAMDEKLNAPEESRQEIFYTPQSEEESVSKARTALENGYEGSIPSAPNSKLTPEQTEALASAGQRLGRGYGQAIADMQGVPVWTTVQQDMSTLMMEALAEDAAANGDWSAYEAWRLVDQQHGEEIARTLQARGKRTRGYTDYLSQVSDYIDGLDITKEARAKAMDDVLPLAKDLQGIQERIEANPDSGEVNTDLINFIEETSKKRGTGTIIRSNLRKLLKGQSTEYLSNVAAAQLKSLAHDYVPVAVGDKVKSYQIISQLLKATTAMRNLGGNETFGFMDALVGSTLGTVIDRAVGTKTGARAVAVDTRWANSGQRKAAVDAMKKSALEVALDIDMGTVGTKYNPSGRAYRMNGNPAERFMSRLEQILSYSLTTSDRFFRGAIEGGTTETLNRLNAGNEAALAQTGDVAEQLADYRLFQNDSLAAQGARATHDFLNRVAGFGGNVEGARRTGGFGLGDLIMPYATVPANLGVKAFEYSPAGIIKGGVDLAKVLKASRNGNLDLAGQNKAVMEIARGATGVPLAILFSALIRSGIIKRSDDEEDYDVTKARQTEGRRETQWNLDATIRWLQGGDRDWQEGDKLISLNWAEPLNAFMDIGSLFSDLQDDGDASVSDYAAKYAYGAFNSFMEMPLMDGLQSAMQAVQYADSDNLGDKIGNFAESTLTSGVTGMIPGLVQQIGRVMDPTTRDTGADTFMGRFANAVQNATPGLRQNLPEKLDSFGNPVTNDNPFLNALNNLILPGQIAEYAPSEVVQALDQVYEDTGKRNFYPDYKPPKSFDYDDTGYELNTEEKRTYQETFGQSYNDLVQNVVDSSEYRQLTPAEKAAVFSEMRSMATAEAKRAIVEGRGGKYESDYDGVANLSDIPGYFATKAMYSTASDEDSRDYSRMPEILRSYNALPDDVKEKLKTGNTSKMDELYTSWQAGASPETWFHVSDGIAEIQPLEGNKNPTAWQKYQYIVSERPQDADALFASFMDESTYARYQTAREFGVSPELFTDYYREKALNNGRKDDCINWMLSQGYSKKQAEYMYYLFKTNVNDLSGFNAGHW